jgi:hypothetical protein
MIVAVTFQAVPMVTGVVTVIFLSNNSKSNCTINNTNISSKMIKSVRVKDTLKYFSKQTIIMCKMRY